MILVKFRDPNIGEWSLNPDWMTPAEENSSGADVISKSIRD